ncbi:uncharacterized protein VTP21DRAFT_1512 [Calcarisporiella thermophila]|uniref:uncharacterized protein n=1 Tax=Calcarisporiella thermophila TaxID=911321 RepID=UPI003741FC41
MNTKFISQYHSMFTRFIIVVFKKHSFFEDIIQIALETCRRINVPIKLYQYQESLPQSITPKQLWNQIKCDIFGLVICFLNLVSVLLRSCSPPLILCFTAKFAYSAISNIRRYCRLLKDLPFFDIFLNNFLRALCNEFFVCICVFQLYQYTLFTKKVTDSQYQLHSAISDTVEITLFKTIWQLFLIQHIVFNLVISLGFIHACLVNGAPWQLNPILELIAMLTGAYAMVANDSSVLVFFLYADLFPRGFYLIHSTLGFFNKRRWSSVMTSAQTLVRMGWLYCIVLKYRDFLAAQS